MSEIHGLDELLDDLGLMAEEIDEAMDYIAKEVATEVHKEAIKNVSGPNTKGKKYKRKLKRKAAGFSSQPYPVGTPTGTLKRSLKVKKMSKGSYKIFADMNIANYAQYVHDGTSKMKERPFLYDAVNNVINNGKYKEVASKIIENILNR